MQEGQQVEIIEPVVRKSGQFLAQGHITLVIIFLHLMEDLLPLLLECIFLLPHPHTNKAI